MSLLQTKLCGLLDKQVMLYLGMSVFTKTTSECKTISLNSLIEVA